MERKVNEMFEFEGKTLQAIETEVADGKRTIQDWIKDTWKDKKYTPFGELSQSPIKPRPKYRPFRNVEECWQEMQKHQPFGWLKDTDTGGYIIISELYDEDIEISGNNGWDYVGLMTCYTFSDGTPFGVKEK